jgi:hypothetical protein
VGSGHAVYAVAAANAVNVERFPPGCDRSFGPCGGVPRRSILVLPVAARPTRQMPTSTIH